MHSIRDAIASISPERLQSHLERLEGVRHPVAAPEALHRAEDHVHASFKAAGLDTVDCTFSDDGRPYRNIVATSPGETHPAESVLVIAHMDTVAGSPGADDNASGVAGVLEIARALAPFRFARTVRYIGVNLEERTSDAADAPMVRGARALLDMAKAERWNIRGVLDLEMIGFASESVPQGAPAGFPPGLPPQGNFVAAVGNEASAFLVQAFGASIPEHAADLPFVPFIVPRQGETMPDVRRSDHAAFWDAGIPAIMITDTANFRNPHYHQATDRAGTLNFEFMARVARAAAGALVNLASDARPSPSSI